MTYNENPRRYWILRGSREVLLGPDHGSLVLPSATSERDAKGSIPGGTRPANRIGLLVSYL